MSKRKYTGRKQTPPSRQFPWQWLVTGAILLIIAGGMIIWNGFNTSPLPPAEGTGAPKLVVDQTTIDEGYLTYNTPIQTAFRLHNAGNQPLKILGQPEVVLAEGC